MSNPDDLLLELMDEYKPHLQTYRHRMNTWNDLLADFNEKTGANYKQIRTLKTRFDRIKEMLAKDEELPIYNVGLLKKLRDEDELSPAGSSYKRSSRVSSNSVSKRSRFGTTKARQDAASPEPVEQEREGSVSQPPPLDSITVFPHTQMKRFHEQQYTSGFASVQDLRRPSLGSSNGVPSNAAASHCSSSAAPTPNSQNPLDDLSNKHLLMNIISAIKNDLKKETAMEEMSSNENVITLGMVYNELLELKQNQQEFQKKVMMKLNYISSLLNQDFLKDHSDIMSLPLIEESHKGEKS
ncbi:LAFE_0G18294g1_1 [Lachancea fermentati]|uniref:LAFE_0G18294g1_1 n=1 Tax=Lachancea fermentati TaxID=4955 RepID=A0A1G4MIT7_LACFM|nr:LAFE_0G18294g1_1 [Lachancea fermentati]